MTNSDTQNYFGLKELPGAILRNVFLAKRTSYNFTLKQEDFTRCKKKPDLLWYTLARGGIHKAEISYSSSGDFRIRNIIWWGWPMYNIQTEDEIISAVQKAKQKNSPSFGLLMEKSLYDKCRKTPTVKDSALLKGGLFSFRTAYYDDTLCAFWYSQCRYKSFCIMQGSLEHSSAQRVLEAGMNGEEAIVFMLDDSSWRLTRRKPEYLSEWTACAGLRGTYVQREDLKTCIFGAEKDAFSPAVRILASVRNGTEARLPAKYKQALTAARILTEKICGETLEMYKQIHDILCRRITYEINTQDEDNSTCVGALVRGKAKCDGYSDAFYLCCGLMGLPSAYQAGKSKVKRKNTIEDNHMWNLIFAGETWRGVDVTWDDAGEDILYDYFNIGLDRMKEAYLFSPSMLPANMAGNTDPSERAVQEYPVSSEIDISIAVMDMRLSGKEKITLRSSEKFMKTLMRDEAVLWRALARAGCLQCDCSYRENTILIRNVVAFQHWAYCDSEDAVSEAAGKIMTKRITEFSFVFEPKLFRKIYSGKQKFARLHDLLSAYGLSFEAFRYNEDCCIVTLLGIK